jgi:hypothetical protein
MLVFNNNPVGCINGGPASEIPSWDEFDEEEFDEEEAVGCAVDELESEREQQSADDALELESGSSLTSFCDQINGTINALFEFKARLARDTAAYLWTSSCSSICLTSLLMQLAVILYRDPRADLQRPATNPYFILPQFPCLFRMTCLA